MFLSLNLVGKAWAEPDWEALAQAVYLAEGGAKATNPYGIMQKYKKTTPKQACINTLRHKYRDWVALKEPKPSYLDYLASKYAPIGAKNDPRGLNKNWKRNVLAILEAQKY